MQNMTQAQLQKAVNAMGWSIAGNVPYGKAHIVENKHDVFSICGAVVDSRNQVRWRDACKKCLLIAEQRIAEK